jgi:hypothetical protein
MGSFMTAVEKRQGAINTAITKRHEAAGISAGKDWKAIDEGATILRRLGLAWRDLRAGTDPMGFGDIGRETIEPEPEPRRFHGGLDDRGFSALEMGTAEAFIQERKSRNQFFGVREDLTVAKQQLTVLNKILETNTRTEKKIEPPLQAANLT